MPNHLTDYNHIYKNKNNFKALLICREKIKQCKICYDLNNVKILTICSKSLLLTCPGFTGDNPESSIENK